jgi:hypothetical protein
MVLNFDKFNFFNDPQLLNILSVVFKFWLEKFETSIEVNFRQLQNILFIDLTFCVSKLDILIDINDEQ